MVCFGLLSTRSSLPYIPATCRLQLNKAGGSHVSLRPPMKPFVSHLSHHSPDFNQLGKVRSGHKHCLAYIGDVVVKGQKLLHLNQM